MSEKQRYLLLINIVECQAIRSLIEAIKDLLGECNIHFDKTGLLIKDTDGSQVALTHVRLYAKEFAYYHCARDLSIGVNLGELHKLLKNVDAQDTLRLYIDKDNINELGLRIENTEKKKVIEFSHKLLDIDDNDIDIRETEFDSIISMPSVELNSLCRLMKDVGTIVELKSIGDELIISCDGDATKMKASLGNNESGVCIQSATKKKEIIQGKFFLRYLNMFTKAYNLSQTVQLHFKNDWPLILKYEVANLGELKFCLAPKLD